MAEWQPMDTAPRDGTSFIACWLDPFIFDEPYIIAETLWIDGEWATMYDFLPTASDKPDCWQPLPDPPQ